MKGNVYVVSLSFVAGIAAVHFRLPWMATILVTLFAFGFSLWKMRWTAAICSLTFFLAFCYFHFVNFENKSHIPADQTTFTGTIASLPRLDGNYFTFFMKLASGEKVRVVDYVRKKSMLPVLQSEKVGMKCSFHGKLEKPEGARNFYAFDYQKYLYQKRIHWEVIPDSLARSSCHDTGVSLYERLQRWRGSGIRWVRNHFPTEVQGISEALIFGDRQDVPDNVLSSYQSLGVVHLLAVSGLHVGLVVSALYFILIRIGVTRERSLLFLLLFLPFYIIMTGAAPSATRAGGMTMLVLLSLFFHRRIHPLDGISGMALLLMVIHPYVLFEVGFQLSFLISFALIVSAPNLQKRYTSRWAQLAAVSIIAQLVSFPVLLYHFYSVSLLSLPLNLIYIPFVSFFVLPLVFLSFFASLLIPFIGHILLSVLVFTVQPAHELLLHLNQMPWAVLNFGKPSLVVVCLFYAVIVYGLLKWETNGGKSRLIVPGLFFMSVCLFQWVLPYFSDAGSVTMLDVGQGDSILVTLPHRKAVYLIDTGGTVHFGGENWEKRKHGFEVGRDIVLPELKARGIHKIDKLILTHSDRDHIGGATGLLGHIPIKEILYGKGPVKTPLLAKKILTRASHLGVSIVRVEEGMSWHVGRQTFHILNPTSKEMSDNNRSVVIAAHIGGLSWLFTGDLEKEGEQRLIRDDPDLRADILKVGHHGSKTSSSESFLDLIDPSVALISVGKNNMYGHPSEGVIQRLKAHGIRVLRTDQLGAICFWFNGGERKFEWMK